MPLTQVEPYIINTASNISLTSANVNLGAVSNLHITGGASGQVLTTDGTGNLSFAAGGAAESVSPFLLMGA